MNGNQRIVSRLLLVLLAGIALAPTAAVAVDIAGSYGNDKVSLALRPADRDGVVSGTVSIDGKVFPCAGRVDAANNSFAGAFDANGSRFALNFSPAADGTFILTSGNARYVLKRTGPPPATQPKVDPKLEPAALKLPPLMQPGLRLSYNTGDSTREGVTLEPDPRGWILKNGRRYSLVGHVANGKEGIRQLTLQQADDEALIAEVRNFSIDANLQGKTLSTMSFGVAAGKTTALDVYWVHPAILAALPQGREEDGQVTLRGKTVIDGREFNSINIAKTDAAGSSSLTYDLATGALLSMLRADITPDLIIATPQGGASFNGTCHIERLTFVNARQVKVAWGGDVNPPDWAKQGAQMTIAGQYRQEIDQLPGLPQIPGGVPGFAIGSAFLFRGGTKQVVIADYHLVKKVDRGGIDVEERGTRCFGSYSYISGLRASPRVLAKLQPNQVLDQDPLTGNRTIFAGVQGNVAIIVEVGTHETYEAHYDLQTGDAVMYRSSVRLLPGTAQITELQVMLRK